MIILTLIVAWIVFTILVKVIKTTVRLALTVAAIIVLLQIGFNISPFDILNYIVDFLENASGAIENTDSIKDFIDTNN